MNPCIELINSDVLDAFQKDIFPEYREAHLPIFSQLFQNATASFTQFPLPSSELEIAPFFKQVTDASLPLEKLSKEAAKRNFSLNRYPNILPYDYNRLKFLHHSKLYFNASLMTAAQQKYILTQGPQCENIRLRVGYTLSTFWAAVIDQQCRLIVNLVQKSEIPSKCDNYWEFDENFKVPVKEEIKLGRSGEFAEISEATWFIENISIVEENETFTIRSYLLIGPQESRTVHHIHFQEWPDREVPEMASFQQLIQLIEKYNSIEHETSPIMVHCSAGIGRTGTLIAAHSLVRRIEKQRERFLANELTINVLEAVMGIRMAREGSVMGEVQLALIFQFLNAYITDLK